MTAPPIAPRSCRLLSGKSQSSPWGGSVRASTTERTKWPSATDKRGVSMLHRLREAKAGPRPHSPSVSGPIPALVFRSVTALGPVGTRDARRPNLRLGRRDNVPRQLHSIRLSGLVSATNVWHSSYRTSPAVQAQRTPPRVPREGATGSLFPVAARLASGVAVTARASRAACWMRLATACGCQQQYVFGTSCNGGQDACIRCREFR